MILIVEVHLTNSVFNLSNWFQLPFFKKTKQKQPPKNKTKNINLKKTQEIKSEFQELKSEFRVKVECLRI